MEPSTGYFRFGAQFGEESTDLCPDLGTSGEPAPVGADESDELVTLVDWRNVILGPGDAVSVPYPVDKQSFNIRPQRLQRRIVRRNFIPRFERQQGLDSAGWTGIKDNHPVLGA